MVEIDALERLSAAASAAPWRCGHTETWHVFTPDGASMGPDRVLLRMNEHFPYSADAALIVAARNSLSELISECRAERAAHLDAEEALLSAVQELNAIRTAAQSLVDALPRCVEFREDAERMQAALRTLQALLKGGAK